MKFSVVVWLLFIFLIYSFIGWCLEVVCIAIKEKKFVNRGISNGPLCTIYGLCAVILTLVFKDFNEIDEIFWLFIGSMIYATALEFIAGKILEKINKGKWWDYSKRKFNLDGYICLEYSLLWGVLGVLVTNVFNPFLLNIYESVNFYIMTLIIFPLIGVVIIDLFTSFITLKSIKTNKISHITNKFGNWLLETIVFRLEDAYPGFKRKLKKEQSTKFASGVGFYKLFWIFFIFAFIGNVVEMVWCRYAMGRWMLRSSLIFFPLSLVWGLAIMIATLLLNRYQKKSGLFLFTIGTIFGGAFEYICSVFTEFFFGTIFWDYSKLPLNLNGRINLIFCFFWGIVAILFVKIVYPKVSKLIESIPKRIGIILTRILCILLIIDLIITGCVMMRHSQRLKGVPAQNIVDRLCDKYAPDEFVIKHWSNMKIAKKD